MDKDGVLEKFFGDEFIVDKDQSMVTVDSRGRRRCG
jgi:hypothetical protein